jgi:hypothetical protein
VLQFRRYYGLTVDGTLSALGTAIQPVLFTSARDTTGGSPASPDWNQVLFTGSSVGDSLVYCEFRYGGGYYSNLPTVEVQGCSPVFRNCVVRKGAQDGIASSSGAQARLADCQIYNNAGVAIRSDVTSVPTWEGNYGAAYVHDNSYNGIFIDGGVIQAATHWRSMGNDSASPNFGIPFFVGTHDLTVDTGVTLTLDPGVSLKFLRWYGLVVNGTLKAIGTSVDHRIVFTSYRDVPGGSPASPDWNQVLFTGSSVGDSLVYCEFRYGGGYYSNLPTVEVQACSPVLDRCNFRSAASTLVGCAPGSRAMIWRSCFQTASAATCAVSADSLNDASYCFWGDRSGPTNLRNPSGAGALLCGTARFSPWLTACDYSEPAVEMSDLAAEEQNGDVLVRWRTSKESDVESFRVFRAHSDGALEALSPDVAPSASHTYSFRDIEPKPGHYTYRIGEVNANGDIVLHGSVEIDVGGKAPVVTMLHPAAPNPFNPTTKLRFDLARAGMVSLEVLDVRGRRVRLLASGRLEAGRHLVTWDGRADLGWKAASGVYYARMRVNGRIWTQRLILLK